MKRILLRWMAVFVASTFMLFGWVYTSQMAPANETVETILAPGEGETIIGVRPPGTTLFVGDTFFVTIYVQDVGPGLSAVQFDLEYDPDILQITSTGPESFLSSTGRNVYCPPLAEISTGVIRQACASSGNAPGPVETGDVIELTFKGIGVGISPLTISNSLLVDDNLTPASITAVEVSSQVEIQTKDEQYSLFLPMVIKDSAAADQGLVSATANPTSGLYVGEAHTGFPRESFDRVPWLSLTLAAITVLSIVVLADAGGIKKTTLARLKKTSELLHGARSYQATYRLLSALVVASMLMSLIKPVLPAQATPVTQTETEEDQTAVTQGSPKRAPELPANRNRAGNRLPEELPGDLQDHLASNAFWADLDNDQDVDTSDMTTLAKIWNCQLGDGCYVSELDFQADDRIDAWDLAWIGNHYDVDPPEIAINTPAAGSVVDQADVQVGGILTDTHEVITVTVNSQQAVLVDSARPCR